MRALILAALVTTAPNVALAQSSSARFGIEGGYVYATVDGSDFDGTDAGTGFHIQGRLMMPNFSFGVGFLRTSHALDGVTDPLIITGFLFEPRYTFSAAGSLRPFVNGRFGLLKQSLSTTIGGFGVDASGPGNVMGAGGGVTFGLSPHMELNMAATYNRLTFGDVTINGSKQSDTGGNGSSVTLQMALSYVFSSATSVGRVR